MHTPRSLSRAETAGDNAIFGLELSATSSSDAIAAAFCAILTLIGLPMRAEDVSAVVYRPAGRGCAHLRLTGPILRAVIHARTQLATFASHITIDLWRSAEERHYIATYVRGSGHRAAPSRADAALTWRHTILRPTAPAFTPPPYPATARLLLPHQPRLRRLLHRRCRCSRRCCC